MYLRLFKCKQIMNLIYVEEINNHCSSSVLMIFITVNLSILVQHCILENNQQLCSTENLEKKFFLYP